MSNYCVAVKEKGDDIVFLRKIVKGGADKSYGIQVAKLAGVPAPVIERAKALLEELTYADITDKVQEVRTPSEKKKRIKKPDQVDLEQMTLFDTVRDEDLLREIRELDIPNLTPMEALNELYSLQSRMKNRWGG